MAGWKITLNGERYRDTLGLPGQDFLHDGTYDPDDRQWWVREREGVSLQRALPFGALEINAYQHKQRLDNFYSYDWDGYTFSDRTRDLGITQSVDLLLHGVAGAHTWALGGEYRDEAWQNATTRQGFANKAVYLQDRFAMSPKTDLVFGARLDDHSAVGSKVTPRIGLTHELAPGMHLRASYAEGYRAPTLYELFFHSPYGVGNPALKPELSRQYEVGLNRHWAHTDLDLTAFFSRI